MDTEEIVPFAETNFRNKRQRFGIKTDDRRRHVYVLGKTGMGKTTLLENMVIDDIRAGRGVAVVDPHGEFAEKLLDFVPEERVKEVIYFNPSDLNHPIAFNAVEAVAPEYRHLITDGLVGVFQKLWAETWGPRLEYVLRNAILALLEIQDATLLGIMRILSDKEYRKWVIAQLKDPVVRAFWVDEFSKYPDRFQAEAIAPIQNKVGQFLANPLIRNIVGQTRTAFDLRDVMDSGKILILNLSKGRIGEGTSKLLGAMMITKLQLAAMSRVDVPEIDRRDFYLYVDEFQNFATVSFANILSEARKYRLDLVLAHQYITQLEEPVRDAVFGNVGTIIVFRIGGFDADFLEKEFEPEFMVTDLVNLMKYHIYLKLMIDGASSRAFSASTLVPYPKLERSFREEIIEHTRTQYGSDREKVEAAIAAWAGPIEPPSSGEAVGPSGRPRRDDRSMFDATCWVCGTTTKVPFQPDGQRPIYCEKCLQEIRSGQREPLIPNRRPPGQRPEEGASRQQQGPPRGERPPRPTPPEGPPVATKPSGDASVSLSNLPPRPVPPEGRGSPRFVGRPEPSAPRHHEETNSLPKKRLEKAQRPQKERPTPDLSGLRDLLGEVESLDNHQSTSDDQQRTTDDE